MQLKLLPILIFCALPIAAFSLGWEQAAYVTLSESSQVVYLSFGPTREQESRGLMVYSSKESMGHKFCVPNLPEWDRTKELRCSASEKAKPGRIYSAAPQNKKLAQEARRIFSLHQKGKQRCAVGEFAGYLYCVQGCDTDQTKLLVRVEYTECAS